MVRIDIEDKVCLCVLLEVENEVLRGDLVPAELLLLLASIEVLLLLLLLELGRMMSAVWRTKRIVWSASDRKLSPIHII